ncbi:aquaporin-like [Melitaea cinxia]|uniref:aquaporin-like n=1 Tax=Melitaea cinxia TaxID=113334 RepID=UPI001E274857|nr:aquaporin-like [Melitaea cinxia]
MAENSPIIVVTEKKDVKEFKIQRPQKNTSWWTNHWRAILGELIVTALLIFFGCLGCVPIEGLPVTPLYSPAGFGLITLLLVQSFAHISGSHMNPCVTLGAMILNKIPIPLGIAYIIVQICGAILGYGILVGLSPTDVVTDGVCANHPHLKHSIYQTLGAEIIFTGTLMLIVCALWDPVNEEKNETVPIKFGLALSGLAICSGPLAGVSMNPARSFGPAVWTGIWTAHWVYWVGPTLGIALSAWFYKLVWLKKKNVKEQPLQAWTNDSNEL